MFYNDLEKLGEIEKTVCDHLSDADCLNDSSDSRELRKIWVNYRHDMATMVGVLREYKDLLQRLEKHEKIHI